MLIQAIIVLKYSDILLRCGDQVRLLPADVKPEYKKYIGKTAILMDYQGGGWYLVEVQIDGEEVKWRGGKGMEKV